MQQSSVLTGRFIAICIIAFLAICNVATFFNFHTYLGDIGFHEQEAGWLIGLYPLTAMILYGLFSQRLKGTNASMAMIIGMLLIAGCGTAYMFVTDATSIAIIRIFNGAGSFLLMASLMVVMVATIPPSRTGQAFSLYSVALLAPYSIMPAVAELLKQFIASPPHLYMYSANLLLPASLLLLVIKPSKIDPPAKTHSEHTPQTQAAWKNLLNGPVLVILLTNAVYFTIFSSLFYLFKGLAVERNIPNAGFFFTIQMGVMVGIRLVGGRVFDTVSKVWLVCLSMLVTGAGFLMLYFLTAPEWIIPIAVVFGLGMGFCVPPLNSLMYLVSKPEYRGYNANMMMLAIHFGSFAGPVAGTWLIDSGGYPALLMGGGLTTCFGALLFLVANPTRHAVTVQ